MKAQRAYVEDYVRKFGSISRNHCLREYITRLSAIICDMQKKGYVFDISKTPTINRWGKGYDYIYILKHKPKLKIYSKEN